MSETPPPTIYPPGAVPISRPVMAPPGAPLRSALAPGASFNNLLQALIPRGPPSIQRPMFAASSHQAPLPAGYPAPVLADPVLVHIKHMTDTFYAAATNDPTFYKLYCNARDAQSHYTTYPNLVFFLRLHLQISWLDLLSRHNRQSEVEGDPAHLISERKELIRWLVKQDQTLKPRAGQYLTHQLAKFPLGFEPNQVRPLIALLDHLYVLENRLFFEPKVIRAPARSEYRIQVVTYLNYEGGEAQIVEDVNISKKIGWFELQRELAIRTHNIQAAQLAYPYGFQSGGYHGHWEYWASETETPEGWSREVSSEAQLKEMKGLLEQGIKIYIMHVSHLPQSFTHSSIIVHIHQTSFTLAPHSQHLIGSLQSCDKLLTFDGIYRPSRWRSRTTCRLQMLWAWGLIVPTSRVAPYLRATLPSFWVNTRTR
jgi:hypothetical protein